MARVSTHPSHRGCAGIADAVRRPRLLRTVASAVLVAAIAVGAPSIAVADIKVIEGLSADGNHPVQKAWRAANVPQCGYCQCGQIMNAAALLSETKSPSDDQILQAMQGNICRCGCYQRIFSAIKSAAKEA